MKIYFSFALVGLKICERRGYDTRRLEREATAKEINHRWHCALLNQHNKVIQSHFGSSTEYSVLSTQAIVWNLVGNFAVGHLWSTMTTHYLTYSCHPELL